MPDSIASKLIRLCYYHTEPKHNKAKTMYTIHDDVIKWKHFPPNWPFGRVIHRWPVNSPHKGQWRGALKFSLVSAWINGWVNNRETSDLRRHRAHWDVIVMYCGLLFIIDPLFPLLVLQLLPPYYRCLSGFRYHSPIYFLVLSYNESQSGNIGLSPFVMWFIVARPAPRNYRWNSGIALRGGFVIR